MRAKWTEKQLQILKEKYPVMGIEIIAYLPYSKKQIRSKAKILQIKFVEKERMHPKTKI